jgi:hypothetical protein
MEKEKERYATEKKTAVLNIAFSFVSNKKKYIT